MKEASRYLGKMLGIVDKILYAVCCSLNMIHMTHPSHTVLSLSKAVPYRQMARIRKGPASHCSMRRKHSKKGIFGWGGGR